MNWRRHLAVNDAFTAELQQRDGDLQAYKGNPPSGEAWAIIVADLHQTHGPGTPRID